KNGEVEIPWKVEYHEDNDDSSSAREIEEQGWTVPEYFFVVEYGGVKSIESKLLYTRDWIHKRLIDESTDEALANIKYTLFLSDGSTIKGTTDENGYMENIHVIKFVSSIEISIGDE
ncbi:MAG: hypothetical protein LBV17_03355, partial [Treponema sp.]|nr:hypothetical protein [Treponema sp.]